MTPLPTAEQLEAELAELDDKRRATAGLLAAMREYEAMVGRRGKDSTVVTNQERPSGRPAPIMEATERVASELMTSTGAPVATALVVAEMVRQGLEVPENNTNNIISARLSNSGKFKGRRGRGYWFSDRPWPGEEADNHDL